MPPSRETKQWKTQLKQRKYEYKEHLFNYSILFFVIFWSWYKCIFYRFNIFALPYSLFYSLSLSISFSLTLSLSLFLSLSISLSTNTVACSCHTTSRHFCPCFHIYLLKVNSQTKSLLYTYLFRKYSVFWVCFCFFKCQCWYAFLFILRGMRWWQVWCYTFNLKGFVVIS